MNINQPSSSYSKIINLLAEQYAEEMGYQNGTSLLPPEAKKEKLKNEYLEQIKTDDLDDHLQKAFGIIQTEGKGYLSSEQWTKLEEELDSAAHVLDNFDFEIVLSTNYAQFLGISTDSLDAINSIARRKFQEERSEEALSLMVLLTTLEADNPEYWHEQGICFKKNKQLEKAASSFKKCLSIDPVHVGSLAFLSDVLFDLDQKSEARAAFEQAQQVMKDQNKEAEWGEYIKYLENKLGDDNKP